MSTEDLHFLNLLAGYGILSVVVEFDRGEFKRNGLNV